MNVEELNLIYHPPSRETAHLRRVEDVIKRFRVYRLAEASPNCRG